MSRWWLLTLLALLVQAKIPDQCWILMLDPGIYHGKAVNACSIECLIAWL